MTYPETAAPPTQRLSRKDWLFIAVCLLLAGACIAVVARYFTTAFPQASIDFRYDRHSSKALAEKVLSAQRVSVTGMKHAVRFDSDTQARFFLERTVGLEKTDKILRKDVRVWAWHHRWFQPLVEEEVSVDIAPTGEIIGYTHRLPEDRAVAGMRAPLPFLRSIGVDTADLTLVTTSERRLPQRMQRIYTYESKTIRPAGAGYRHVVAIDGDIVTEYTQTLKVPDAWLRSYREMRSKNHAAGAVDQILHVILMIGAVVVLIVQLRRGNLSLRFLLAIGAAAVVLQALLVLNGAPSQLAWYDTTTSYPAFIGNLIFSGAINSVGTAMLLIVICGAGEVLYRQRLPRQLAIPRLWNRKALASKRVFLSMILGYALVPMFIAYQVVFYLTAQRAGAWSPAEVPYDDMLNTALPWAAVLFAGFFPAFSEEFLSRAFAIPFLQRFVRSRWFAIVLAGFIWGFGHATYPNQPYWIRGVEVGVAGIVAGLLMDRFGLLPLLIWHYTIDAVYTATLLFASGNVYYVVSAAVASLIFAVPLLASIVLYLRNRGFVPDDDLTNATMPVAAPSRPSGAEGFSPPTDPGGLKPAAPLTARRVLLCVALIAAAGIAIAVRPDSPSDALDYRISAERAKEIARRHVRKPFERVIALPVEGFRSWDRDSGREEGGAPGNFDSIAATYLVQNGMSVGNLVEIFRSRIEAGTWMVRFFTPMQKEEIFVEVDPRTSRVVGYHKYQDEALPGAALPQPLAAQLAVRTFALYGLDARSFELKEALTFAQPRRRDWLFHFDERIPLAPRANRRVTVRVSGGEVTQFNTTVKIPESVYREAHEQTLLNVALVVMKIAGSVVILALVIAGLVMATRRHGLPWRRPLRWALVLSIVPILNVIANYESTLFGYSTTVAWETFQVGLFTRFVSEAGLQIGLVFLALAGLEAAMPHALALLSREGRARFGRSAVVAALAALAVFVLVDVATRHLAHAIPSAAVVELVAPSEVAVRFPAFLEMGRALTGAIIFSGAVALFTFALRGGEEIQGGRICEGDEVRWEARRRSDAGTSLRSRNEADGLVAPQRRSPWISSPPLRKRVAVITIPAVFCALLDPSVTLAQAPVMLARTLVLAVLVWVVARHILGGNPLAWPLAFLLGTTLQTAALLLNNNRPDLFANAVALMIFAGLMILWIGRRSDARVV